QLLTIPYKDPEKEREYNRMYHKRWRYASIENYEKDLAYHRQWYATHKKSESVRRKLRHAEEKKAVWEPLWKKQHGRCAICKVPNPTDVDHNKKTRIVRGLLCHRCNLYMCGIESPALERALAYLRYHQEHPTGIRYRLQSTKPGRESGITIFETVFGRESPRPRPKYKISPNWKLEAINAFKKN